MKTDRTIDINIDISPFEMGENYTFKHKINGKIFHGKLIKRIKNLPPAFSGKVKGERRPCHLPLHKVLGDSNWEHMVGAS